MSLSHGEEFSHVHSPSAMWVQSVTTHGFEVCTRETGAGTNGTGVVNWLAFQAHPRIIQGTVTIDGVWTTQTKCKKVAFKQVNKNYYINTSVLLGFLPLRKSIYFHM